MQDIASIWRKYRRGNKLVMCTSYRKDMVCLYFTLKVKCKRTVFFLQRKKSTFSIHSFFSWRTIWWLKKVTNYINDHSGNPPTYLRGVRSPKISKREDVRFLLKMGEMTRRGMRKKERNA